jgi:DNA-binding FadR family transcriptional regulator
MELELAARRATAEGIQNIERYMKETEASTKSQEAFLEADLASHLALGETAHNRIFIIALLHLIRNLMRQWSQSTLP